MRSFIRRLFFGIKFFAYCAGILICLYYLGGFPLVFLLILIFYLFELILPDLKRKFSNKLSG